MREPKLNSSDGRMWPGTSNCCAAAMGCLTVAFLNQSFTGSRRSEILEPCDDRSTSSQRYATDVAIDYDFSSDARPEEETPMVRDFEDHCWRDILDEEIVEIYEPYRREVRVGLNPALLAIDLNNKAYQGGNCLCPRSQSALPRLLRRECPEGNRAESTAAGSREQSRRAGDLGDPPCRHRRRAIDASWQGQGGRGTLSHQG